MKVLVLKNNLMFTIFKRKKVCFAGFLLFNIPKERLAT